MRCTVLARLVQSSAEEFKIQDMMIKITTVDTHTNQYSGQIYKRTYQVALNLIQISVF